MLAKRIVVLTLLLLDVGLGNVAQAQTSSGTSPSQSATITRVKIQRASGPSGSSPTSATAPVTFGQVFAQGDLPKSGSLSASLDDGTAVRLQVDPKASNPDGSIRHAVITALVPFDRYGKTTLLLNRNASAPAISQGAGPAELLSNGFKADVQIKLNGETYTASADELLRSTSKPSVWLSGPLVNEWHVSAPLKSDKGQAHPHLTARFAIRSYTGMHSATVDVVIENNWAYAPAPQNLIYDVVVSVAGKAVYSKSALTHFHHARWRKVFWWGSDNTVAIQHDTAYLIATKAVPNYDQSIRIAPLAIQKMDARFVGAATEPMGNGLAVPYMPTTGGRSDIGLLPGWAVSYLLSMNEITRKVTLGTADMSGTWSMHYRNQITDRPVSLIDFPYMTLVGSASDTYNPKTKKSEAFPPCGGDCATPYSADTAHEPALTYLPYLVTGDYYYLEELQFWTMYDLFQSNPGYRANIKGLFHQTQVRAQAWSLRDLTYAAYITPDADPFKKQFEQFLSDNLDWYNATYQPKGSQANVFGALIDANAREYLDQTAISPWQDDFFTSAVGRAMELGFDKAKPLLAWKAQFPIKRMTDPGYCWIAAAVYTFKVTDHNGAPFYTDMSSAYLASNPSDITALPCASSAMASALKLKTNEMIGHSDEPEGFPSNMQPALALSVHSGVPGAQQAWQRFDSRSVKPDYSVAPQFAIIPRN